MPASIEATEEVEEVVPAEEVPVAVETPAEVPAVIDDGVPATQEVPTSEDGNFNEFLDVKNQTDSEPKPKVDATQPVNPTAVVPPQLKETIAQQAARKARDFSDLPADAKSHFERMSNEAFNYIKPLYLQGLKDKAELADAKERLAKIPTDGALPPSYYENPNAYVLSPEYAQASTNAQQAALVLDHWQAQLDGVRGGAKEFQMLGIDPSTKQIVITGKQTVNEGSQSYLEKMFFGANRQAEKYQQALDGASVQHRAKHSEAMSALKNYEDSTFKAFSDPKHPLQPQVKDAISRMHPAFRDNPLASTLAKAIVSLTVVANKYATLVKSGAGKGAIVPKVNGKQALAGPTAGGASVEAAPKGDDVTMDDFDAVKNS